MRGVCPPGKWTKSRILEVRASYARGTQPASSTTDQPSIKSVPTTSVSESKPVQLSNSTSPHVPESVPETAEKDVATEDGIMSSDAKDKENRESGKDRIGDVEDNTEEPINEQPHDHQPSEDDNRLSSEDNHLPLSRIPTIDNENFTVDSTSSPGNPPLLPSDPPSRIPTNDNENITVGSTSSPGNPPLLLSDPLSTIPRIDNEIVGIGFFGERILDTLTMIVCMFGASESLIVFTVQFKL